jgi:small subunit ribosomal protein S21
VGTPPKAPALIPTLGLLPSQARRKRAISARSPAAQGVAACEDTAKPISQKKEKHLQVIVRDNNVEQALKALKKKMQREGIFREMKRRSSYEKPSERRVREKAEGIRRARKAARKQAQREGLLPAPKRKKVLPGRR